ncbi:MAG: tRNA (adenosine(37)-N6)-threonylcarbamoyltransferase complex dimerization subunit type 1 TsaB [Bacillota bacterium]|nr:tRNA (adenosine(37)-N6)-threonylcarbamoyltransferase complex dimerization subunit type 1 TsaB [Bacillota bacterium]
MRVLGIDTSTFTGGVALVSGDEVVAEYSAIVTRTSSESIAAVCERLLAEAGWAVSDLDGVAVAIGPGSFTGVRIGVTMAKVLGYALDLPIGPVVTLDAIAANLPFSRALVCPLISARRNLVYTATYRVGGQYPERMTDYEVRDVCELAARLRVHTDVDVDADLDAQSGLDAYSDSHTHAHAGGAEVLFVGDGAMAHRQVILENARGRAAIGPEWCIGPRPAVVAAMGKLEIEAGRAANVYELEPFYLGRSSAEMVRGEATSGGGRAQGGF